MKFLFFIPIFTLIATFDAVQGNAIEDTNYEKEEIQDPNVDPTEVEVWNGKIRGTVSSSTSGRPFYSYTGIKYATAQRFKHSVPTGKWDGVFNANQYCSVCPQLQGNTPIGNEDCLCLHVYSPNLRPHKPLPVMVLIHGGAFTLGSVNSYLPHRFMNRDVIIAMMNYRLGAFGNLCAGDSELPGNYAINDQITALKWIRQNIGAFGGNPNQVIIFGQSSGGASVTYLLLSPPAKEYFHAGISQSGSGVGAWAFSETPLEITKHLAAQLNCPTDTTRNIANCIRDRTPAEVLIASRIIRDGNNYIIPFVPCKDHLYVPEDPRTAFLNGNFNKVPLMIGTNSFDGSVNYIVAPQLFEVPYHIYVQQILTSIIQNLTEFDNNLDLMTKIVENEYYDGYDVNNKLIFRNQSIQILTDAYFMAPAQLTATYASKYVKTYNYYFDYAESFSTFNVTGQIGVQHGDELLLMFYSPLLVFSEADKQMSELLLDHWTSFATHLTPSTATSVWTPIKHDCDIDYKYFGNNEVVMKTGLRTKKAFLWNYILYYLNKF